LRFSNTNIIRNIREAVFAGAASHIASRRNSIVTPSHIARIIG